VISVSAIRARNAHWSCRATTIRIMKFIPANIPSYFLNMHIWLVVRLVKNPVMDDLVDVVVCNFIRVCTITLPANY
jgi:hypothetical protein